MPRTGRPTAPADSRRYWRRAGAGAGSVRARWRSGAGRPGARERGGGRRGTLENGEGVGGERLGTWAASSLSLIRSQLGRGGSTYSVLHTAKLGAPPAHSQ